MNRRMRRWIFCVLSLDFWWREGWTISVEKHCRTDEGRGEARALIPLHFCVVLRRRINRKLSEWARRKRNERRMDALTFFSLYLNFPPCSSLCIQFFLLLEASLAWKERIEIWPRLHRLGYAALFSVSIPRHWSTTPNVPIPSSFSFFFKESETNQKKKGMYLFYARGQDRRYGKYLKGDFELPLN